MSAPGNILSFPSRLEAGQASVAPPYAELVTATNFSFLRGASTARDLVLEALCLDYSGLGIADRNTVSGVVRAWSELKQIRKDGLPAPSKVREGGSPGETSWIEHPREASFIPSRSELKRRAKALKLCVGARLCFDDSTPDIVAYPVNRHGWGRLCRILTSGNLRPLPGEDRPIKGECRLLFEDLAAHARDLLFIVIPGDALDPLGSFLPRLRDIAPTWLGATMHRCGRDTRRLEQLKSISTAAGVPLIATNDVLFHDAGQRDLQDVMTCIREGVRIESAGRLLEVNAERHLKDGLEMALLFRATPDAIEQTQIFLNLINFDLEELSKYEYPQEPVPAGWSDQKYLEDRVWFYAGMKYNWRIPKKVKRLLRRELAFITKKGMAQYFLTIFDMVRVAEDKGILCQGRGSAANSAVCYVLGITSVNPAGFDVLFERFLSNERDEPPDIDVDFEHERREEIIQHIYKRYGRDRAGIAATVIHYRPRSAMREVGKVFGLTDDVTARLSGLVWGSWGPAPAEKQLRQAGLDPENPVFHRALAFANRLLGFPRHLSQHVGGFVLTQSRLDEIVPIGHAAMDDRTFIEWDKDDLDALKLLKVDVLALGMLTCIRKARDLLYKHGGPRLGLRDFPPEDPAVYDMLCKGDSIGVFQVESRAQINMLPRMKPRKMYDLVIEVAIVRPGPIQGNMVHPYLKRRNGEEDVVFPSPSREHGEEDELYKVLNKTLGIPLFQEQAMKLAMVAAKFNSEEANGLRRAMATFRNAGTIHLYKDMMVDRMVARGYERDFAKRCFAQIEGFGSYGFPESHAAAFGQLVYVSSWLKRHHPAAFACALLNSQPMGFYAPAQIVGDAKKSGVEVRPVDVNFSEYENLLEGEGDEPLALRLGFRQIDGVQKDEADELVARRGRGYSSIEDMRERGRVSAPMMNRLSDADAFRSIGSDRREASWSVRRLPNDSVLPLFAAADARELGAEPESRLPEMPLREHISADYQTARLSLKGHPMQILRPMLAAERVLSCKQTEELKDGRWARTAGVVLVRQRPGNGKAIFITLEDETGITNVLLWARVFERYRAEVMGARLLLVEGRVQKSKEGVTHLMGARVTDRSSELARLSEDHHPEIELTRADEVKHPQRGDAMFVHPRDVRNLPKSRDFH